VYAATRKNAEEIGAALRGSGWDAPVYHGGTSPNERSRISADFAAGRTRVLVATNAFGMGVDRPDVRIVVHAQPPASLEAYYQEVGRAGRDGKPARGLLLVSRADLALRRRLCRRGPDGAPATPKDAARALVRFGELVRYIDASTCRHAVLVRHFGEELEKADITCGLCDVCLDKLAPPADFPAADDAPDTVRDPPAFDPAPRPPPKRRAAPVPQGVPETLYGALSRYRAARAASLGVPAYVVAPNRALVEMAMLRPSTADELTRIHGMGPTRITAHGDGFLRALKDATHPDA
jgi:ATP-dependent DNA helicase RecQ